MLRRRRGAEPCRVVLRRGRRRVSDAGAIACLHGVARTYSDTDWPQIAEIYRLLEVRWPTPVVRVNRAVAVAEVAGPRAGLDLLAELVGTSAERWHLYWSTRADFQRRLGEMAAAALVPAGAHAVPLRVSFLTRRLTNRGSRTNGGRPWVRDPF